MKKECPSWALLLIIFLSVGFVCSWFHDHVVTRELEGLRASLEAAYEDCEFQKDDAYHNGYDDGYNDGYEDGWDDGCPVGYGDGYEDGYSDGLLDRITN